MIAGSPRILIIRLSAIGDVVRVLPALQILRERYPEAHIDWMVERKAADIVEGHPALDGVIVFERPGGAWKSSREFAGLCRDIRNKRYDMVVDFHGILKSGLVAAASRAKQRIGFARPRSQEGSNLFYTKQVSVPLDKLNRAEENLRLCQALAADARWPSPVIYVSDEVQETVHDYTDSEFDSDKLVVAMHAPVDRPEKQWPLAHFAGLADLLLADGRFEVLLTWGPGQFGVVEEVQSLMRRKASVAPEMPDLKHYAALVARCALYVGGDTGPMHIAAAMGTPVIGVFGGTNPAQHAPYLLPGKALYAGASTGHSANGLAAAQVRLAAITPDEAYAACIQQLFE
ncbi:MAG: glycosyltransferase family 9 protein [Candidatus Hydrogenedentes bacterium]|nr:glycosyltransferase family 9 protein [Candidatus Hydrogenedentota bacterium]